MIILGYHRVTPEQRGDLSVTIGQFRAQLQFLIQNGLPNLSLDAILGDSRLRCALTRGFAITFDDGYRDNYLHALPVLQELGLKATIFVTVDYVDREVLYPWDERQSRKRDDLCEEDFSVTWKHLVEMRDSGVFSIGSHTLSHPELTSVSIDVARHEITESKRVLENRLGGQVDLFCYPRGRMDRSTIPLVEEAGYKAAVVTPWDPIPISRFTLPRVVMASNTTLASLRQRTGTFVQALLWTGLYPYAISVRSKVRKSNRRPPADETRLVS